MARRLGIAIKEEKTVGRHVDGIVEMMLDATQNYLSPLTQERLFSWHSALLPTGRSGMHTIAVGQWRSDEKGPMQVVSGAVGREKVHYEAPPALLLDREMTTFLEWLNQTAHIDPVLKAGIAHFWFVTIHPFDDGNGRIGRAISDLLLARADGTSYRYYSLSRQIEKERKSYYAYLETQQRGYLDITSWLQWYLECLKNAILSSEMTLANILFKARLWDKINSQGGANERQRTVINRMLEDDFEGFMNTSKYAKLAKCSTDTALRDIQTLKERFVLIQNPGGGRSTSYRLPARE